MRSKPRMQLSLDHPSMPLSLGTIKDLGYGGYFLNKSVVYCARNKSKLLILDCHMYITFLHAYCMYRFIVCQFEDVWESSEYIR